MPIELAARRLSRERITGEARRLLDASTLCAIATVSPGGGAHVNTAYFAWDDRFDLVWLSDPGARHSRNLRLSSKTAIAVYDSRQVWGRPDRGIQLFGSAREVVDRIARECERTYTKRFPKYASPEFGGYGWYRFRPRRIKLFDERALGAGVFVSASVRSGAVAWERTEIYRGARGSLPLTHHAGRGERRTGPWPDR